MSSSPSAEARPDHRLAAVALTALIVAAAGPLSRAVEAVILALAVLLALPHGGADIVLGQRLLAPRLARWWCPAFAAGYAGAAGATLLLWQACPGAALAAFLLLSAAHFAERGRGLPVALVTGTLPIVLPAVIHGDQVARVFELLAPGDGPMLARIAAGPGPAVCGAAIVLMLGARPTRPALTIVVATALPFVLLPPLPAFALYFVVLHAPAALAELAAMLRTDHAALRRAALLPSIVVAVGTAVAVLRMPAPPADALVRTVFVALAALTVPHMILAGLADGTRLPRKAATPGAPAAGC